MKYLTNLLIIILVTSCATTPQLPAPYVMTTEQRFSKCTEQNVDKYIGDCVMQTFEIEKGHQGWMELYGTQDDWEKVAITNNDLSKKYELGELNAETSNLLFTSVYESTRKKVNKIADQMRAQAEADRIRKAQMWMAVGEALKSSNNTLNGYNSAYIPRSPTTSITQGQSGFLENEYVSGFNKICVYDGVSGQFTITIGATSLCPLSANQNTIPSIGTGQTGFLETEYDSGFNKICVYDGVSGQFTKTISATSLCPLSATQD